MSVGRKIRREAEVKLTYDVGCRRDILVQIGWITLFLCCRTRQRWGIRLGRRIGRRMLRKNTVGKYDSGETIMLVDPSTHGSLCFLMSDGILDQHLQPLDLLQRVLRTTRELSNIEIATEVGHGGLRSLGPLPTLLVKGGKCPDAQWFRTIA